MRRALGFAAAIALLIGGGAAAQDSDFGGYTAMRIDYVGVLQGFYDSGTLERFSEGVRITLLSDDPGQRPVPISANAMTFRYAQGQTMPSLIVMEGGVEIDHPEASIRAGRAEWNFDSGELVFTGNPVLRNERFKEMRGEVMKMNFKTGAFEVKQAKIEELPLEGQEGVATADPNLLREQDVRDWPGFIGKMKAEAAGDAPAPGRHLVALLPGSLREAVQAMSPEAIAAERATVLREINRVMQTPNLYDAAAWSGIALGEEASGLLALEARDAAQLVRMNRLLLEAAYPDLIVRR